VVPVLCDFPGVHEPGIEPHAAPEVQQGKQPDPRADLFGLGYVLVSLLRGAAADGPEGRSEDWQSGRPGPAMKTMQHLPRGVEELIHQLVDRHPGRRPRSAAEVADALARLRGAEAEARDLRLPLVGGLGLLTVAAMGVAAFVFRDGGGRPELPVEEPTVEHVRVVQPQPTEQPALAEVEPPSEPAGASPSEAPLPRPAPVVTADEPPPEAEPVAEPEQPPSEPPVVEAAPEPALAEVEPETVEDKAAPATPDASGLSGSWSGEANKRPLMMQLSVSPEGKVSGTISVQVGSNMQKRPVAGTVDPDSGALRLVETEGQRPSTYTGSLSTSGGSGSIVLGGKTRGSWSLSR
jgi:hypothetical protein